MIYNILKDQGKAQLDIIALRCETSAYCIATIVLNMELKGVIRPLLGKRFEVV